MAFKQISSPHGHNPQSTSWIMQLVLLSTLPGFLALSYQFGWGTFINLIIAVVTSLIAESAILALRNRPIAFYLKDYSAAVTAVGTAGLDFEVFALRVLSPRYFFWEVAAGGESRSDCSDLLLCCFLCFCSPGPEQPSPAPFSFMLGPCVPFATALSTNCLPFPPSPVR